MKEKTSIQQASEEKLVKSSFSVTFIIQKGKLRVDGTAPIMARVIVNKRMTHIATKQYIRPDRWLPEEHKTRGCTQKEKEINEYLSTFKMARIEAGGCTR